MNTLQADQLTLLPPSARIRCYAGDDATAAFRFSENGVPMVLGGTFLAQIRTLPESLTPLGAFTIDSSEAAIGKILLTLPSTLAQTLPKNVALVWDLQNTNVGKKTLVRGTITIEPDVSRE